MSDALYTTRLYFEPPRPGLARINGQQRIPTECPQIPGLPPLVGIDVAPAAGTWVATPRHGPRRDLEQAERAAVLKWLAEWVGQS